jgi:hypothetical protein
MTKTYNCSVINKYLIVGKHLLTTFLVILKSLKMISMTPNFSKIFKRTLIEKLCKLM